MIFRYQDYKSFLVAAKAEIDVFPLRDWRGQTGLILRHDVDLCLPPALRLAEIEMTANVRSSFFVMTSADTYNVLSAASRAELRTLDAWGFEIGLHFDPRVHGDLSESEIPIFARREAGVLEDILGKNVSSISLHNPTMHGKFEVPGFINAYDSRVFGPEKYLSDSRMHFRDDPCTLIAKARTETCQLLLHPLHFSEEGMGYPAPFVSYIAGHIDRVHETFIVNEAYRLATQPHLRDHVASSVEPQRPGGCATQEEDGQ